MKTKNLLLPLLAATAGPLLFQALFTKSKSATPIQDDDPYAGIDAYIEAQMHSLGIPGASLAILDGDKILHARGFGRAGPGREAPTPQTPFFIGSLTKSITALAIMQLVEKGRIDLDAPVQSYLPWFRVADPEASTRMTVRHLLNQTSGLPMLPSEAALANFDDAPDAIERQVRALSTCRIARPVGTKFEYSNTNYNVLGAIVESVSGEAYADYVQQHIFKPLHMEHSYASRAMARQDGLAMGHRYWFGHPVPAPDLPIPLGSLPSGQLISSAEDMAHYLMAFLNGGRCEGVQIVSKEGIEELLRGEAEWREFGALIGYYGMGWVNQECDGIRIVSHSGTVPDFGTSMAVIPEQNKGLVLLFNANHAMLKIALDEVGLGAAQRLAGATPSGQIFSAPIWVMRGQLLLPILQIAGVLSTLRQLHRWRADPSLFPTRRRMWRQHLLRPMLPNLLAALTLLPMLGNMRGWIQLFMPDFSWIARICGGFAVAWTLLRTSLILRFLQRH